MRVLSFLGHIQIISLKFPDKIFEKILKNLKIFLCKIQPKCGIIKHKDYCNERESYDR